MDGEGFLVELLMTAHFVFYMNMESSGFLSLSD
jgi:hypothetical protein